MSEKQAPWKNKYEAEIAKTSVSFDAGDNLTTEKKSDEVSIPANISLHPYNLFVIEVEKPVEDTAGDMTLSIYNRSKIDGTNIRDILHSTHTVEKITGSATYRDFIVQGLFSGSENKIKIGCKFATDSGAIEVKCRVCRL